MSRQTTEEIKTANTFCFDQEGSSEPGYFAFPDPR